MSEENKKAGLEKESFGQRAFGGGTPFSNAMNFLGTLILANIYFIICCLPLVTIGASMTALSSCMIKYREEGDVKITSLFFKNFAKNFIDSTLVWIIDAGFISMIALYSLNILRNGSTIFDVITLAIMIVILFFLLVHFAFYYVILARYENDVLTQIKNSFLVGISHLGWTLIIMITWILVLGFFLLAPNMLLYFGWIIIMLGFSGLCYMTTPMYLGVFRKIELRDPDA